MVFGKPKLYRQKFFLVILKTLSLFIPEREHSENQLQKRVGDEMKDNTTNQIILKETKRVGFIGAGKVGFSLGKLFAEGGIHVTGYYSKHVESAKQAAQFTQSKVYEDCEQLVNVSNVIFLTVPDKEIKSVFHQIEKYDLKGKQVCHCSGALTAEEAFPKIEMLGATGYSIHPLFPVSSKLTSYREMSDAFFCLEGNPEGLTEWEKILAPICHVKRIDKNCKVKYHAACAIASNLYCALTKLSLELLEDCDFTNQEAIKALAPLMKSNMQHILEDGPVQALTGPVERADAGTVEKHLAVLDAADDKMLYQSVTKKLTKVAKEKNPGRDYSKIIGLCER